MVGGSYAPPPRAEVAARHPQGSGGGPKDPKVTLVDRFNFEKIKSENSKKVTDLGLGAPCEG
jgi:hypothetical protein